MIPIRGLRAPVAAKAPEPPGRLYHRANGSLFSRSKNWSHDLDAELRRLWAAGVSGTLIAEALGHGLSRNAVIGRAHRLGLERRANPAGETRRG